MTAIAEHFIEVVTPRQRVLSNASAGRSRVAFAAILIAVSAGASSSLLYTARADAQINALYDNTLTACNVAAARVRQAQAMEARQRQTAVQIDQAFALSQRTLPSVVLAGITRSLPAGMSVNSLKIETVNGRTIASIDGSGAEPDRFATRLLASGVFCNIVTNPTDNGLFELSATISDTTRFGQQLASRSGSAQ